MCTCITRHRLERTSGLVPASQQDAKASGGDRTAPQGDNSAAAGTPSVMVVSHSPVLVQLYIPLSQLCSLISPAQGP